MKKLLFILLVGILTVSCGPGKEGANPSPSSYNSI